MARSACPQFAGSKTFVSSATTSLAWRDVDAKNIYDISHVCNQKKKKRKTMILCDPRTSVLGWQQRTFVTCIRFKWELCKPRTASALSQFRFLGWKQNLHQVHIYKDRLFEWSVQFLCDTNISCVSSMFSTKHVKCSYVSSMSPRRYFRIWIERHL